VNKKVIAALVVVALAGAAVAAVPIVESHAAAGIKTEIERDGATKVGSVEVGLFERRVTLLDLKSTRGAALSVGRWEASGLAWPLGELLRGRTPLAGFDWGDPLRADRIELSDVHLVDSATTSGWSIGSLVIEGFDLARYDAQYRGDYRSQALVARALAALTIRRLEERNVLFSLPGSNDTFGAASAVVERYERGRIGSLTVSSLEAAAKADPAPLYKIADIKSAGIDMTRLIAALSSDKWQPGAPVGRAHVDSFNASGFAGEMLARYGISLGSVGLETVREGDRLSHSRTRVEGFVLAPPTRGLQGLQTRLALQTMGLKEVKLDLDCAGTDDRAKGELTLDRCALVGQDLAEVDLTARVVDVDPPFWRAIDDGDLVALDESHAALGEMQLILADKSLLERSLKALSAVTGKPVSETRANLAGEIRRYQPAGILISEDMTKLLDIVARFVERGGTLTFDAKPDPPIDIARFQPLMKPGADLVRLLGLSATLSTPR
jgi:hypothetical protein